MILNMEPPSLISIMMPKLDPFLSLEEVTDELFLNAKKCVSLMMNLLYQSRNMSEDDEIEIKYDK